MNEPHSYQDQTHSTNHDASTPKTSSVHQDNCKQYVERPNISQISLQQETDRQIDEINDMTKINMTNSEVD